MANVKTRSNAYVWLIWALGAGFFFTEYFARVSTGVMVPELMHAFNIDALSVGALSAFFYYAYVAMQIPVGAMVDRFGARRLLTVTAAICGAGCFLFAGADTIWVARLGRFMMGFGAAFAFVGTLKLANVWFSATRFGLLAGLTQALGMLGASVGEGPMAYSVEAIGWRHTMLWVGGLLLLLSILIALLVRDRPANPQAKTTCTHSSKELWQGLATVLRNRNSWLNGVYVGLLYAPTAAFAELWGVRYLVRTYGLETETAALAIGLVFIGWGVGGPLIGWLSDRMQKRKPLMMFSALGSLVMLSAVLYLHLPIVLVFICLFVYGMFNTGVAISYAVASEINPHRIAGTSMAFANMASILVGTLLQPLVGELLDLNWDGTIVDSIPVYSAHAFETAMVILPIILIAAFLVSWFIPETHCKSVGEK